jgi:hypothetical protein
VKTVFIVLGVIFALGLCLVGSCVFMFSRLLGPPAEAADAFIAKVAAGDLRGAYDSADQSLKASMSYESFADAAKAIGLDKITLAKWRSTNVRNTTADVSGSANTTGGEIAEMAMTLVKSDTWRVSQVTVNGRSLTADGGSDAMPTSVSASEAKALALQTLLDWDAAIKANDFSAFYNNIADIWKKEVTPIGLRESFKAFIDAEADIAGIADVDPVLSEPPKVNDAGLLSIKGHYPTNPLKVFFELGYMWERQGWRLVRINVRMAEE